MRVLYIDCGMGAAGDMLTAALLELLPEQNEFIEELNALGIPGVKYIKENSSATSSDIWYVITEAKENRFTNKRFIDRMYDIMDVIPDQETKDVLNSLYMKEVLGVD